MATDYTDGLALKAMKNVFDYLPIAYNEPNNVEARQKMADASCMAGMAFANAFLGVCILWHISWRIPSSAPRYCKCADDLSGS